HLHLHSFPTRRSSDLGNPANGSTYNVWESSSLSTATNRATSVTITGYNTHWNTAGADQVHAGDYILSWNSWTDYGFVNTGTIGIDRKSTRLNSSHLVI